MTAAADLIERLGLEPHPEGGWYRETWRGIAECGQRPSGSAIFYLLAAGEVSRRHRVDSTEIWHHYRGAPIELRIGASGAPSSSDAVHLLGPEIEHGQVPQILVPPWDWQEARSLGEFSLVGCTVSPAFEFSGFELAEPDEGESSSAVDT